MGYIISGGIVSNIEVLWIARNKCRAMNKNSQYVLAPEDCHYSIQKACDIVGLKMKPLKIDINIPPNQIAAVGCLCGITETGRSEDIISWSKYCKDYNIHLHIDACFGGYYRYCKDSDLLSKPNKAMLNNYYLADS